MSWQQLVMFMNIQLSAVISWEQSLILGQDKQSLIQTTTVFAGLGSTHMYSRCVQLWFWEALDIPAVTNSPDYC